MMNHLNDNQDMEWNRQQAIRRVIDGEATPDEAAFVKNRLEKSDGWMQSAKRVEAMIGGLRGLPAFTPPAHVWKRVRSEVHCSRPDGSISGWFQFTFTGRRILRFAPAAICVLVLAGLWLSQPSVQSVYEIVDVTDENSVGVEAEAYIAYHDLSNENASARDGLIAYYTYGLSE
ncbi:hypothetical protein K8I31_03840 [bacterium]|nr:hypothetical protein [bacterium]